jgi:hypothetical protein
MSSGRPHGTALPPGAALPSATPTPCWPTTTSSHLYRMFPKLGITSRVQLRTLLDGSQVAGR